MRDDAPLVFLSRVERSRVLTPPSPSPSGPGGVDHCWKPRRDAGLNSITGREKLRRSSARGVEYVGPVDDAQKNSLLGEAAAMIVPIEWNEPFGIVFAEALACGTPVISCPRGALPEIVRPGTDGFFVNSVEEACEAVSNLDKIDRAACRKRAEEFFSLPVITAQYERLYRGAHCGAMTRMQAHRHCRGTFPAEQLGRSSSLSALGATSAGIWLGANHCHAHTRLLLRRNLIRRFWSLLAPSCALFGSKTFPIKPVRLVGDIGVRALYWHFKALDELVRPQGDRLCSYHHSVELLGAAWRTALPPPSLSFRHRLS